MASRDDLGDRMKTYEYPSTSRKAQKGLPVVARLDGKGFHNFCSGLQKPFDVRFHSLMKQVTSSLVQRFGASIGYTQSDEITLVFYAAAGSVSEYMYAGRFQKMDSLLAAYASSMFNRDLHAFIPEKGANVEIFDCRSFTVPSLVEAYNAVLWRQFDCAKNSVSMAAQSMFPHKVLQGLSGPTMVAKMWADKGVQYEKFPSEFRLGSFARRVQILKELDPETIKKLAAIGKNFDPATKVQRSAIQFESVNLLDLEDGVSYIVGAK